MMKVVGIFLIVIGIIGFIFGVISLLEYLEMADNLRDSDDPMMGVVPTNLVLGVVSIPIFVIGLIIVMRSMKKAGES